MRRSQWIALAALVATAALVLVLASRNPPASPIPADATHLSAPSRDRCLDCHGPGGENPRSANHPPRNDCSGCHSSARPSQGS